MRLGSFLIDLRPLRIPAFRRLWAASAVTAIGGSFSAVAVPVQLFALTRSSAYVGAAAAVSMATLAVAALTAGRVADAVDRRLVLIAGNAVLGIAYLGLGLAALAGGSVPATLALVAVQGAGLGATMTASGAAVPRVVPPDLLLAATSLSSLTRYTGAVLGPLLAGVLLPRTGFAPLFMLDAAALTAMLWAVAGLPSLPTAPAPPEEPPRGADRLGAGFRRLVRERLLLAVVLVDLAAMVGAMPSALYPELAERTYAAPAGGGAVLSLLYAAYPAGVLAAAMLSGSFSRAGRHGALMAGAAASWGLCVVVLGVTADLAVALLSLVAGGAVNLVLSTTRNAITQSHTSDAVLGRVQGSLVVVLIGGPQLANALHGVAGALLGVRTAIACGGLATVLAVGGVLLSFPVLWRYDATAAQHRPGVLRRSTHV